ncbi:hypothetical protein CVD25_14850 [Bacillus canaveralius]|uniref:Uncharacterized protein n=1 Tax=Bacillus canaveralius TaxID=1403243 RepID=A0A2N5GMX3_9BACI|nr:hypothetical protein [Bacillus canaveralius]PLR83478.1 hypothetical protein CU635_09285 [Bacillus canaveralius]PLR95341.1 hypothetical protein CVD25_14850 [Bacillus canaveralius]
MKLVLDAVKSDFPDYKIINITEVGFPIFKKTVVCLATLYKGLPVVLDFTLKLLNQGFNTNQISKLLSIDEELIKNAVYDLELNNMYDLKTQTLTDDGRKYISNNKYEQLQRVELPISVDGFTGYIKKSRNYITNKNAKSTNLNTLEPILDKKNNNIIHGQIIKRILEEYIKESNSEYEGQLVEMVSVNEKPTEYKKFYIVVIEDLDKKSRLVVYDRNTKVNYFDSELINADEIGIKMFTDNSIDIFIEKVIGTKDLEVYGEESVGEIYNILEYDYFTRDFNSVFFDIPMIEAYEIKDEWINELERYLKRKRSVKINFTGYCYPTTNIKNKVYQIIELSKKYNNLELQHKIEYEYAKVILDNKNGYIDKIAKYKLNLKNNPTCVTHNIFKLNKVKAKAETVNSESNNKLIKPINNLNELKDLIKNIVESAKSLDAEMEDYYGMGWLDNGQFLNEYNLDNIKLAKNEKSYSNFTKDLNASMVEVIDERGKEMGINNYFYMDFKKNFPKLHYALDRLRVYRNSMQHNNLNSQNLEKYLNYIKSDLNGTFPEFYSNGYLILQTIILKEIFNAIIETSRDLNKVAL